MQVPQIPFNVPFKTGKEIPFAAEALRSGILAGDGPFTLRCHEWLEKKLTAKKALLTHSCTAALEMSAILADIRPGDEIIMPSYTFVAAANVFVMRGAVPVFVDIRPDTMNMNEKLVEAAITQKTKAIVPVHYAGIACEMDTLMTLAKKHNLLVIEDAAHGILSAYKGRPLGSIGHLGCVSFHETKNITSGKGGALLINDERFIPRAEILRDTGTNRGDFLRGLVKNYSWQDIGSCYQLGELFAAFLWAQMAEAESITGKRIQIWNTYHENLKELEVSKAALKRPSVPPECLHNAHIYPVVLRSAAERDRVISFMSAQGVHAAFHYIPLHSTPAGRRFGRPGGELAHTEDISRRLLRLPLWIGVNTEKVIQTLVQAIHAQS